MSQIEILNDDCIGGIKKLKKDSVDLIVTSPPYNVRLGDLKDRTNPQNLVKNSYDKYDDNLEHSEYIEWLKSIFKEGKRVLKKGGRVCINIADGRNGRVPTHVDISYFMEHDLDFTPMGTIIWDKDQVTSRTSWGSFASPSSPCFPCPFEYILIFAKEDRKIQWRGETDLTKDEFIEWAFGRWKIAPESASRVGHPAPFPEELPYRLIKMLSWKGATVLDPFMGSGTTGVVCKKINRNFIGIDHSEKYCELAKKRINKVEIDFFE